MGFTAQFTLALFLVLLLSWTIECSYQNGETQIISKNNNNNDNKNETIEQQKNNNTKEEEEKKIKLIKQKFSNNKPKTDKSDNGDDKDNKIINNNNNNRIENKTNDIEKASGIIINNVTREDMGRSINIDKYISKEFHNNNNEYTLPLSSDTEKFIDPNFHLTSYYTTEDYHKFDTSTGLTTPKSPLFDKKFNEATRSFDEIDHLTTPITPVFDQYFNKTVKSIDETLHHFEQDEEEDEAEDEKSKSDEQLDEKHGGNSKKLILKQIDDKLIRNDTKRINYVNYKNVVKNNTDDKNSKHRDVIYEEETKYDYVGSFINNTEILDDNPNENKINKDEEKEIKKENSDNVGEITTQHSTTLTTTPPPPPPPPPPSSISSTTPKINNELSNKIEPETSKSIEISVKLTTAKPQVNDNENNIVKSNNNQIQLTTSSPTTSTTPTTTTTAIPSTTQQVVVTTDETSKVFLNTETVSSTVTTETVTNSEQTTTTEPTSLSTTPIYYTETAEVTTVTVDFTTLPIEHNTAAQTIKDVTVTVPTTETSEFTTKEFTASPIDVTVTESIRDNTIDLTSTTTNTKKEEFRTETSVRTSKSMTVTSDVTTETTLLTVTETPKIKQDPFEYDLNEDTSQEHDDKHLKHSTTSTSTEIVIFESIDNHTTILPEIFKPDLRYPTTHGGDNKSVTESDESNQITGDSDGLILDTSNSDNSGTIAAIAISSVGGVCLILLAGLLIIMKKRQKRFNYGKRCRPVSLDDYSMDNISVQNSIRRKGALRASKRSFGNPAFDDPSSISHPLNFSDLVKFANNSEEIPKEFEEIPQIIARTTELPEGCDVKNRYANVIPLPETRVFLSPIDGFPNSDYINANYVTGPKNTKGYYIACQAPMENTVDDFWRMIWEQQSKVILMLTLLYENRTEKCFDYLPPSEVLDCHRLFGDFQVTLRKREVKDKYIISSLQLKNMNTGTWREVTHFWYLGWPEKGVPSEANSLIAFLIEARSYMKTSSIDRKQVTNGDLNNGNMLNCEVSPVVVHCSPGTGRTGVVIACDIAIREFEQTRVVDIPRIVYRIRRDRASAVQTKEQYAFIYKVIGVYASKLTGGGLDSL